MTVPPSPDMPPPSQVPPQPASSQPPPPGPVSPQPAPPQPAASHLPSTRPVAPPAPGSQSTIPPPARQDGPPPPEAWPPEGSTIVANVVSKSFGKLVAVSGVSFAIQPGVTALLGPNGAGKSTMLRMLSGQVAPTSGSILINGGNPRTNAETRGQIGLVPQQDGVFEREMALDVVKLAAILSDIDDPESRARWALGLTEMDPDLDRPVGSFSKGMRQRVKLAQALVHDPSVLMMDEPLNGLDPRQRRHMVELFQKLGQMGKTVLISSHVLEEVERFGSHVVVIAKGRLAAQGDFHGIRRLMDNQPMRVRVVSDRIKDVGAELIRSGAVLGFTITDNDRAEITTDNILLFRRDIARVCQSADARLLEVAPLDDDLESVFRYLTGGNK